MCNVFFREQIEATSSRITSGWAGTDVRAAFSAIGRAISGTETFAEAWTEFKDNLTGNRASPDETVVGVEIDLPDGSGASAMRQLTADTVLLPRGVSPSSVDADAKSVSGDADMLTFDYVARTGSSELAEPITAYDDGVVLADGESTLYGRYLIIMHGEITAQYFHLPKLLVRSGDEVVKGQTIAEGD
jgi:hypothetical protein